MWKSLKQILTDFWQTKRKLLGNASEKHCDLANLSILEETCSITVASFQVFCLQPDQTLFNADRIVIYHERRLSMRQSNHNVHWCSHSFGRVERE